MPHIELTPARALVDEPVRIRLVDFPPRREVAVEARASNWDNVEWHSHAVFITDDDGAVDLLTQRPASGSYEEADGMGLFWSMTPPSEAREGFGPIIADPITVAMTAEAKGTPPAAASCERLIVADSVTPSAVREDGLVGHMFRPAGPGPHPGVILLGGSEGGLITSYAAFVASHGFATLALAYFGSDGLPEILRRIPLEYFQNAIAWLQEQRDINGGGVALIGYSRGGELALLLGSTFSEVKAVVGVVPSHVVWPGGLDDSAWSYQGVPVPTMPPESRPSTTSKRRPPANEVGPIDLAPRFIAGLQDKSAEENAAIRVESIDGPVLLVSGKEDSMWPSSFMATRVMDRLAEHHHPYSFEHLAYDHAGHTVCDLPFLPTAPIPSRHPVLGFEVNYGGTAKGVASATRDAWPKIFEFLWRSA